MAPSANLQELINKMPDPDGRGMYCTNIDKEAIEAAIAEIHKGGKDNLLAIIDMLKEPKIGEPVSDVKPHYALHCLANYVLQIRDEKARREFGETLASQLGGSRPKGVQAYLCQELQWAGRREAVAGLGKLLLDEDLVDPAAMALVAIKDGAAEVLRAAVPQAKGGCRLVVIHSLAALADAASAAIFKEALKDPDREVRLAAGAGLANIADATAADMLLKAADGAEGWERIQQTKHCLVLAEKLVAAGNKSAAATIYKRLRDSRSDPSEAYVHEAAERGLATCA